MAIAEMEPMTRSAGARESLAENEYERWHAWPVNWSGVWVGALAAIAIVLLVGLATAAVDSHMYVRGADLKKIGWVGIVIGVCGAFFSFVAGGWIAAKIAGILRSEPAMLHGAIAWLVAVPLLAFAGAMGATSYVGGWYSGMVGASASITDRAMTLDRTSESRNNSAAASTNQPADDAAKAARNSALFAITALILGLAGSVIGGWIASGEPMNFSNHRDHTRYANAA